MNLVQIKKLKESGFSEAQIFVLEEITNTKTDELVTKKDLDVTKLELQKEIIQIKLELEKQIIQVKLELHKEIEQVKLGIQKSKVEFHKMINKQFWKIITTLIIVLSPIYAFMIKILYNF